MPVDATLEPTNLLFLMGALRAILDPDAVNRLAFSDQARRIEALGGREAILRMTGQEFGFTPLGDNLVPRRPE